MGGLPPVIPFHALPVWIPFPVLQAAGDDTALMRSPHVDA